MVTASHNDNGWTGVKMGSARPVTFGPVEMGALRDIVINGEYKLAPGGSYVFVENFFDRYFRDLTTRPEAEASHEGRRRLRQWHCGRIRSPDP